MADSVHVRFLRGFLSFLEPDAFRAFAGGWNGMYGRFALCAQSDEEFRRSIADPTSLETQSGRYEQDRALFVFFVSGLATIECLHYALFAAGALATPGSAPTSEGSFPSLKFPLSTEADRRAVTPRCCAKAFRRAFPNEPLSVALADLQKDPDYWEWTDVRNVIAHRLSPGWTTLPGGEEKYIGWLGIPLDETTTATRRKWLADWLAKILVATDAFIEAHLEKSAT